MRQHYVAVVTVAEVATLAVGARQMAAATHMTQARRPVAVQMAGELRQHSVEVVAEAEVATLATAAIAAHQHLQKKLPNLDLSHDLRTNTMDGYLVSEDACKTAMSNSDISNYHLFAIWSIPETSNMEFAKPDRVTTAHRVLHQFYKYRSAPS